MYQYTEFDRQFVRARATQFRDQLERNLAGELGDDEFRPLRLQNGWYIQRHAPMLRVAIPYGELSSRQLRQLARVAKELDRDFLHFTTRQNAQFNWIPIEKSADAMDLLADVDMHGIQTSGNCIRNITSDVFAGIAPDEIVDPRPYCELLRQWSTLQPEFAFLPLTAILNLRGRKANSGCSVLHWRSSSQYGRGSTISSGAMPASTSEVMLRMQLPEVWMPCMSTSASKSIASADFSIGIQLNCAFWRVVKCRKSRSSSLATRASWRSWRLASSP